MNPLIFFSSKVSSALVNITLKEYLLRTDKGLG